eukprot:CAMPEP_0183741544 /NCGR_PEP_ID=MMETSP0737-20130205/62395_1 /TAXON_ID=385413 /ORGANISM="Thalassiosira miniscula, Strain CCMP1093" /LENGTH=46 /DNA_ID= /DNA_START= /DNA_END= /DNA_ORIENTATION=
MTKSEVRGNEPQRNTYNNQSDGVRAYGVAPINISGWNGDAKQVDEK